MGSKGGQQAKPSWFIIKPYKLKSGELTLFEMENMRKILKTSVFFHRKLLSGLLREHRLALAITYAN